jgi:hypothetical protein
MRYAIVENEVVTNVVVATAEVASERGWIEIPDVVQIGWSLDESGNFIPSRLDVETEAKTVRSKRDALLASSDVKVLPDRWAILSSEQQAAFSTYRQALRDVPQQAGFPFNVVWPQTP